MSGERRHMEDPKHGAVCTVLGHECANDLINVRIIIPNSRSGTRRNEFHIELRTAVTN